MAGHADCAGARLRAPPGRCGAAAPPPLTPRRPGRATALGLKTDFPVRRLHVGPISVDELGRLLAARLESQLPRPQLMRLHGASGGNPYFALEIVRAFEDSPTGPEWGAALPVPESLGALLRSRIDVLSAA